MKMSGEQKISASRQKVWDAINDPEVLRQCIPGCQSLDKEGDDRMRATVEIKIGPIGARFLGAVTLSDLDPPNGLTITGEGQGGMAGFAKGGAKVRLTDAGPGETVLAYDVEVEVGGRLAQLGGPIIDATAKQLAGVFFDKFGALVGAPAQPAPQATAQATSAGPTAAPMRPLPAQANLSAPSKSLPIAWMLALTVAALVGFLIGRSQGGVGSDWAGLAIGLLVLVAAGAGFEFGRRSSTAVMVIDPALLRPHSEGSAG